MNIEGRSAVVRAGIELVGRKVGRARGVGFGKVQHVKAEQRKLAFAHAEVGDQLILVIDAAGLKLIRILVHAVGPHAGSGSDVIRTRQEGVDVVAIQLMQATRVDVGAGESNIFPKAMLYPDGRLHVHRSREVGRNGVGRRCGFARRRRAVE